jgi:hypothetical protein
MINRIAGWAQDRQQDRSQRARQPRPFVTASDVKQVVDSAEELIVKYPAAVLAVSFFAGVAIAWWIKRR